MAASVAVVQFAKGDQLPASVMTQEYVASLSFGYQDNINRTVNGRQRRLPQWIDGLERRLRFDIYDQMALDSQIQSCFGLLVAGILGGGLNFLPSVDPDDPRYVVATAAVKFVRECLLTHMQTPFMEEFLPDMLKAIYKGHRIAEKVCYPVAESPIPGKLIWKSAKIKPRRRVAFVVDEFMNVLGITVPPLLGQTEIPLIEREKFAVLTWAPTDNDPRGTSAYQFIYEPWWNKQKLRPGHLQYLHQFASPSLIGTLAEQTAWNQERDPNTGQPLLDSTGQPIFKNRAADMLKELEKFQNSSVIVIPHGAGVEVVEVKGDGRAFLMAMDLNNMEITKGLLFQTMATEATAAGSRAASSVHADIVSVVVEYGISILAKMIWTDFVKPLIDWNFPEGTPIPNVQLPGANKADFLAWASAVSKLLTVDYFDPSQFPELDAFLNLPVRSKSSVDLRQQAHEKALKNVAEGKALPPAPNAGGKAKAKDAAAQDNRA